MEYHILYLNFFYSRISIWFNEQALKFWVLNSNYEIVRLNIAVYY